MVTGINYIKGFLLIAVLTKAVVHLLFGRRVIQKLQIVK